MRRACSPAIPRLPTSGALLVADCHLPHTIITRAAPPAVSHPRQHLYRWKNRAQNGNNKKSPFCIVNENVFAWFSSFSLQVQVALDRLFLFSLTPFYTLLVVIVGVDDDGDGGLNFCSQKQQTPLVPAHSLQQMQGFKVSFENISAKVKHYIQYISS
jgi:hypothetical protein